MTTHFRIQLPGTTESPALERPKCCAADCTEPSANFVALELYYVQKTRGRITRAVRPAILQMPELGLCAGHARTFTAADVLTDDLWRSLTAAARSPLKRHLTKLLLGAPWWPAT